MAEGLAHSPEALAADGNYRDAEFLLHPLRDRLDIVPDKADGTFGEDADTLCQRKEFFQFVERRIESLIASVDDVPLLEIRGYVHCAEGVHTRYAVVIISPRPPTVLAAADWTAADGYLVLHRAPDNALGARVCAATD